MYKIFSYNFWNNVPIFIIFSLLERSPFHLDVVNFVANRKFRVYLSVSKCLDCKSSPNSSIFMRFGYVFAVSNLSLSTENWDLMLDTFYRDIWKSLTFVFIYAPLLSLWDNTTITRTDSITSFNNGIQLRNLV